MGFYAVSYTHLDVYKRQDRKFQPVTSGSENGQTTKFYIRETALSVKSELVMITYGAKETVVVDIFGVFDLRQVARLSSIRPK